MTNEEFVQEIDRQAAVSCFTDQEFQDQILIDVIARPGYYTTYKVWRFVWSRNPGNVRCYRAVWDLWRAGKIKMNWRGRWFVTELGYE